ncbi:MAG TPA: hypothetical protein PLZ29_08955, partial [Spirochaetota bacterium]|nr:hypothetical protein [Spirochaetota bacterium]
TIFEGDYQRFLETIGWENESEPVKKEYENINEQKLNKKELRRIRSQLLLEKQNECKPLQETVSSIEQEITRHENLLKILNEEIINASQLQKSDDIQHLSIEISKTKKQLVVLYDKLEEIMSLYEERTRHYERLIQEYAV